MVVKLKLHDGRERTATVPYRGAPCVIVAGLRCECSRDLDLQIAGGKLTRDDEHGCEAPAACTRCLGSVGTLIVAYSTLFGATEDNAVLNGRPRVY